jgi:hypothetical protein
MEENEVNEQYPVDLTAVYPEKSSRWLALGRLFLMVPIAIVLIPHFVLLYLLGIASFFAWIFGQFAVLFTGRYPKGLYEFILGVLRWQFRVNAYVFGLVDKYPPFNLK